MSQSFLYKTLASPDASPSAVQQTLLSVEAAGIRGLTGEIGMLFAQRVKGITAVIICP
jgi:hypothetical protein